MQPNFSQLKPVAGQPNFAQLKPVVPVKPTIMSKIGGALGINDTMARGKETGEAYRSGKISGGQLASETALGIGSVVAKATGVPKIWEGIDYVARGQGKYNPIPEKNLYSDAMAGLGEGINKVAEIPSVKNTLASPSGESFKRMASSAMDISSLLPVGPVKNAVTKRISPAEEYLAQQARKGAEEAVDKNIRKGFEGQVKDVRELEDSAFRAKKGLELLVNEKDIQIPDMKAPLGSGAKKTFDIQKSSPNEVITALSETGNKIAQIGRQATVQATAQGRTLDLVQANAVIDNAVASGDVTQAMAERMKLQLGQTGGTPTGVHDWVEGINQRYQNKFEKGTIEDTQASKLANDVARVLRAQLDTVVDRKGYAEAYANNQALKKLLVSVAKKANKKVDFGDISTNVGLDTAFSVLTGNPAYMARTLAESSLRGVIGATRRNAGMKAFRQASVSAGKYPSSAKMPNKNPKLDIQQGGLGIQDVPVSSRTVTIPRRAMTRPENLLPAPRPRAIPLGGEVLGQKVDADGKLVRAPLGKSTVRAVPAQAGKPRVNPQTGRMEKTFTSEVATPHKAPDMPEQLKGDARAENLHKQITDNVKAQERAYKRGDTAKMSTLKRAYNYLIKKWDALVQKIKDTPNKQGGFLGFGKKKARPESATDRKFRRQDEETWKERGMKMTPDGRLKNRQRGALGAPSEMRSDAPVPPRKQTVKVGLSAVSGRDDIVKSKLVEELDELNAKAQALFKEGKFDEAQNVFNSITQKAKAPIEKRFKGTQFKPKWSANGTGQGVFEGVPEPTLDFSVEVTGMKDRNLLQTILEDISNKDFTQKSLLTYEHHSSDLTVKFGVSDQKAGISVEPYVSFLPEKELSLADIKEVNEALSEAGLQFMSIKDGGKTIDLVNLSIYNKNHAEFIGQINKFEELLNARGIRGSAKYGASEVRLVGSNARRGGERNATASYEGSKRAFHARNKDYAKPSEINSKVLDVLKYKERVSKGELESIVKSGDVSPAEKAVFSRVLEQIKDGKVAMRDVQKRLMSNLLQLKGGEETKYASYGLDNVGLHGVAKSFVLRTPTYKHGLGGGHMGGDDVYGWARYSKNGRNGDTASIAELQSDLNQDPDSIAKLKSSQTARDLDNVNAKIAQAEENLGHGDELYKSRISQETLDRDMLIFERLKKDRTDLEAKLAKEQGQEYDFARERKIGVEKTILQHDEMMHKKALDNQKEKDVTHDARDHSLEESRTRVDADVAMYSKKIADTKKRIAALEKRKPSPLGGQIVALSKDYKYRDRILEETINHLITKEKVKTIRIATPSTVAKIEGYTGAGDGYDARPYEIVSGDNDVLTYGDVIDGYDGHMTVVNVDGGEIVVASSDKVKTFTVDEHIYGEVEYRLEETRGELKKMGWDGEKDIPTEELIAKAEDFDIWEAQQVAKDLDDLEGLSERISVDDFLERVDEYTRNHMDVYDDLRSIYGNNNVFFEDMGRGNERVYVVEDGGHTESLRQPEDYLDSNMDDASAFDRDPKVAAETMDSTQMGVLNGYYDLMKRWVPKYEKATGAKVKSIEDDNGHTWLEITDPRVPPKTTF